MISRDEAKIKTDEAKKTYVDPYTQDQLDHVSQMIEECIGKAQYTWSQRLPDEKYPMSKHSEKAIKILESFGYKVEKQINEWVEISWE